MRARQHIKLVPSGDGQTVHIPREFALPGEDAEIRKEDETLIIEVPKKTTQSLIDLLATLQPIEEDFPEIDDPPPEPFEL